MRKIVLGLSILSIFAGASVFLFGCDNQKIIFNRESQAANLINKFSPKNQDVKKYSGVIILKNEDNKESNIRFGPSDINFDMPIKFK